MSKKTVSVIIPFYNEEQNLFFLHQLLVKTAAKSSYLFELIYVDDGSSDESAKVITKIIKKKTNQKVKIKLISFWRNMGQTSAIAAGIDHAKGQLIAFIDADLQNDPNDLLEMLKNIEKGYEAVFGWRKSRNDTLLRSLISRVANNIVRYLFKIPIHDLGCALKIFRREIFDDLRLYGESHRIIALLTYMRSQNIIEIPVSHEIRKYGTSKYGYSRIVKLFLDLITVKFLNSYGTKPSYIFGGVGLLTNLVGIFFLAIVAYHKFALKVYVHNNPLFIIAIFLMIVGIQFILMGLIAEILVRIYFESQKKPIYEIKKIIF